MHQKPVKLQKLFLIGSGSANVAFTFHDAEQVTTHKRRSGANAESIDDLVGDGSGSKLVCREIHLKQLAVSLDGEDAAERAEAQRLRFLVVKTEYGVCRCKGGMTTKVDLAAGGEPAELIAVAVLKRKGGLGKIVLRRYLLHQLVRQGLIQHAHSSGVTRKNLVGKGIDHILLHVFVPPCCL